jgi:hypothetical protein
MPLLPGYKKNFETLCRAVSAGDAALMECKLAATGEMVAVISAVNRHPDGAIDLVPLAMLFQGNPYQIVNPPKPGGGFHSQQEGFHV